MSSALDNEIKFLAGIGQQRAALIGKELGIISCRDLLHHYPYKYIDRTRVYKISELDSDSTLTFVQIKGRVQNMRLIGNDPKQRLSVSVIDSTGEVELLWFAGIDWAKKRIEVGREYLIFGRPSLFNGKFSFAHAELEAPMAEDALKTRRMRCMYSATERLNKVGAGSRALGVAIADLWSKFSYEIKETLPEYLIMSEKLMPLREALYNIHFPVSKEMLFKAEYRLKFEEFFCIQLSLLTEKNIRIHRGSGYLFESVGDSFNDFYKNNLPFELTNAQKRVLKEIRTDTRSAKQMNRLLQGDVGSGKTIVALMSMLLAKDNGYQACIMAPTEILANQHYESILHMTKGLNINVGLLTGSVKKRDRKVIHEALISGEIDILIGTHALLEDNVEFKCLGFVVIDEQHRFGVEQRSRLWRKNITPPHILVMTATPIPRTLAMTLYGDLDISIIDELPPGRKQIRTLNYNDSRRLQLFGFMKSEIAKGRQIYIVYPLIKESESLDYKSVEDGYESIVRAFPPPDFRIVIVHGQMSAQDKEYGMRQFKEGHADIMIATSVIEVGVNIPNATVMVIESSQRFGLSQLHQLRGRVGRGGDQSYCILMSDYKLSVISRKRLEAMVSTTDGFELAEMDLKLRGYGEIDGTRQSGEMFALKIAHIGKDNGILIRAREVAEMILENDNLLQAPENNLLKELIKGSKKMGPIDFSQIS